MGARSAPRSTQRLAARSLSRHQGRPGDHVLEAGVLPVARERGAQVAPAPGKMLLLIDLEEGRIIAMTTSRPISPRATLRAMAQAHPVQWATCRCQEIFAARDQRGAARSAANVRLHAERAKFLMTPMAHRSGGGRLMGNGRPSRCCRTAQAAHLLQANFAQVTNPPIDSIREVVRSLVSFIGPGRTCSTSRSTAKIKRLEVYQPILSNEDWADPPDRPGQGQPVLLDHHRSPTPPRRAPPAVGSPRRGVRETGEAVRSRVQHRHPVGPRHRARPHPDPSLLATSAVHHLPDQAGLRVGRVVWRRAGTQCISFACWRVRAGGHQPGFDTLEQHTARARRS